MNLFGFLLICTVSFLLGIILGFLSKPPKFSNGQSDFSSQTIVYEISEKQNCEQRNFLNYDGSEQN